MSKRSIPITLAFAAMLGVLTASVQADFRVRTDNLSNPSGYTNWGAPDGTVQTVVRTSDNYVYRDNVPSSLVLSENHQVTIFGRTWPNTIQFVKYEASSDDMFGIDQVEITNGSGTVIQTFGVDNQNAWCLSTDQQDGYTADCNGNPARAAYTFYPNGTIVP